MKRRFLRFFVLFTLILLGAIGYIKGCDSQMLPKQKPESSLVKDSLEKNPGTVSDSFVIVAAGEHYDRSGFHQLIFGEHYRELWAQPVSMPRFRIDSVLGGMKILHKGGSMQTLNLRLESKKGREYVLRTIDKDNANALPSFFQVKILKFMIRDQTSALHPYSALIVAKLAEAAGLFHTKPRLFFIPYDPNFGQYKDEFEGRVALLEEQPNSTWKDSELFDNPDDIVSTRTMLDNKFESQKSVVDQRAYARARIFDLWINDWDRHADQWRWAEFTDKGQLIYKPIPRDRDAALFKFDSGIIPRLVKLFNPKFQSFRYSYGNVKGLIKNAHEIDKLLLNGLSQEDFLNIAKDLQNKFSDSIIINAVASWPEEIYGKAGIETISKLKTRRENLVEAANDYYTILFKEVTITGTDQDETFRIHRVNNQETLITILDKNDKILFSHTYNHSVTKKISIYGLKGEDEFYLEGETDKGIEIRIYGGEGSDKLRDNSNVWGYERKTKVIDTERDNDFEFGPETDDQTTDDPRVLYFDRSGERR